MTATFYFVKETALARLYMRKNGHEFWVPRSVIEHTTKYPPSHALDLPLHEITVADWWWDKNIEQEVDTSEFIDDDEGKL